MLTPPCPRGYQRRVGTAARADCHDAAVSAAFAYFAPFTHSAIVFHAGSFLSANWRPPE